MARVLIVDDEITTVDVLSKALELFGHEPLPAYDGEDALRSLGQGIPDLILLDLMMPGMDGYETLHRVRQLPGARDLPVVIVTASPDPDLEQRVAAAGGNGCLRKPVDLDLLSRTIEDHYRAKPSRRS
ncbi:MAG: response regulator [Anaerolineales bacterium]